VDGIEIERVPSLTPESFVRNYIARGRPVIVSEEPALRSVSQRWSLDYLVSKHTSHRVAVEHYPSGDRSKFWTYTDMELEAYVRLIREDPSQRARYYLAEKPLAEVLPHTHAEVAIPGVLRGMSIKDISLFAGIDTFTNGHYHVTPVEAVLTQLCGAKVLKLYEPRQLAALHPYPWYSMRWNWSRISMCDADAVLPSRATPHVCTLHAGDLLFIPQGWFHLARGLGESISITYFFKGSWAHANARIALRDLAAYAERRVLIDPLMRLSGSAQGIGKLLRLGAFLGIVPRAELDIWTARFGAPVPRARPAGEQEGACLHPETTQGVDCGSGRAAQPGPAVGSREAHKPSAPLRG
jgi:hypothetical protein